MTGVAVAGGRGDSPVCRTGRSRWWRPSRKAGEDTDLNLPRRSGLEVLGELKADPDLHTIPVVVLTASRAGTDIVRRCELHANADVIKPSGAARFAAAIGHIGDFFLILVERPQ